MTGRVGLDRLSCPIEIGQRGREKAHLFVNHIMDTLTLDHFACGEHSGILRGGVIDSPPMRVLPFDRFRDGQCVSEEMAYKTDRITLQNPAFRGIVNLESVVVSRQYAVSDKTKMEPFESRHTLFLSDLSYQRCLQLLQDARSSIKNPTRSGSPTTRRGAH